MIICISNFGLYFIEDFSVFIEPYSESAFSGDENLASCCEETKLISAS